jgi:thioredoxin 2
MEPAARFAKLNTDEARAVAARYGIRSIPTLIVFKGGLEVTRQPGAMAAAQLMRWVSDAL